MSYFKELSAAINQFGIALCNGNKDCTISATAGNYAYKKESTYWLFMERIIDLTFYPIDGENHCRKAYEGDKKEDFKEGWKIPLAMLTGFFCIVISLITWGYYLFKMIVK